MRSYIHDYMFFSSLVQYLVDLVRAKMRKQIFYTPYVTGLDTICNNPSPPLVDIVRFCLLRIAVSLTVLKRIF